MANSRSPRVLLLEPLRAIPADLAMVAVLTVSTNVAVFAPLVRETPLRIVLGLAFLLFVPGYAFLAALFPERGASPITDARTDAGESESGSPEVGADHAEARTGIDGLERTVLSAVLSVAIVPLLGLVLNVTPWGIRLVPFAVALSGFVLGATAVAVVRRWQLPPARRFRVPYRAWVADGRELLLEPETRFDAVLNALVIISVIVAVGSVTVAMVGPSTGPGLASTQGEQFSAVYLLTEDDDGDLIADDYPSELEAGEGTNLTVGVDNEELRSVEYTLVVAEQRIDRHNETNVTVTEQRELERFEPALAHNETWLESQIVAPTMTGEVRLVWLLYPEEVPDEPSIENAPYHVHLWVDVTESGS